MTLRLATFNVQHGRRPDGQVDVGLLGRVCAALDADVLALQEVDVGGSRSGEVDEGAAVAATTGLAAAFGCCLVRRDGGRYGNALLARGRIEDVEVLALPRVRTDGEDRCAVLARVEVDGPVSVLSVVTCHLSLHPEEAQAQLAATAAALLGRVGPHVLLGDYNLGPSVASAVVGPFGLTLAAGGPTFPASHPRRRIDHVAVRGLSVEAVVVPAVPVSDHRPLVVEVRERF